MGNPILLLCIIAAALVLTLGLQDPDYAKTIIKRLVKRVMKAVFYAVGFLAYIFIYLPSYYLNRK